MDTPPTFLFHTSTGHGVGLAKDDPVLSTWSGRQKDWMTSSGLLTGKR